MRGFGDLRATALYPLCLWRTNSRNIVIWTSFGDGASSWGSKIGGLKTNTMC